MKRIRASLWVALLFALIACAPGTAAAEAPQPTNKAQLTSDTSITSAGTLPSTDTVTAAPAPADSLPNDTHVAVPASSPPSVFSKSICSPGWLEACTILPLATLLFSVFLVVYGRFFWVIEPVNARLRARHAILKARLRSMSSTTLEGEKEKKKYEYSAAAVNGILKNVYNSKGGSDSLIPPHPTLPNRRMLLAFTGLHVSAWHQLHEAERILFDLNPKGVARSQAIISLNQLEAIADAPVRLKLELAKALKNTSDECLDSDSLENQHFICLIKEAKAIVHEAQDRAFEASASAQNKAFWLIGFGLLTVLSFGFIFDGAPLLMLAGAAGGMLARLRKATGIKESVFDYGTAWPVLFLTPFTGALTGWSGVAMLVALQHMGLFVIQKMPLNLFDANLFAALFALIFGMSATLFDRFVEKLETNMGAERRHGSTPTEIASLIGDESGGSRDHDNPGHKPPPPEPAASIDEKPGGGTPPRK